MTSTVKTCDHCGKVQELSIAQDKDKLLGYVEAIRKDWFAEVKSQKGTRDFCSPRCIAAFFAAVDLEEDQKAERTKIETWIPTLRGMWEKAREVSNLEGGDLSLNRLEGISQAAGHLDGAINGLKSFCFEKEFSSVIQTQPRQSTP